MRRGVGSDASCSSRAKPSTPLSGVRISWLIVARKLLLARLAASASRCASASSSSARRRSVMSSTTQMVPVSWRRFGSTARPRMRSNSLVPSARGTRRSMSIVSPATCEDSYVATNSLNLSRSRNSTSVGLPTSEPSGSPSMRSSCGLTRSRRWLRTRHTPTTALSRMASPSCFARSVSVTSRVVITVTGSPSQSNVAAVISTKCCAPSADQATERKSRTQPCAASARPSASIGSWSRQKPSS